PQVGPVGAREDLQEHPPALRPDHAGDRRPVVVPGALAPALIGPAPRRVFGIGGLDACFPPHFGTSAPPRPPRPPAAAAARPPSAVIARSRARGKRAAPLSSHHRRMPRAANGAVSWSMPTPPTPGRG